MCWYDEGLYDDVDSVNGMLPTCAGHENKKEKMMINVLIWRLCNEGRDDSENAMLISTDYEIYDDNDNHNMENIYWIWKHWHLWWWQWKCDMTYWLTYISDENESKIVKQYVHSVAIRILRQ